MISYPRSINFSLFFTILIVTLLVMTSSCSAFKYESAPAPSKMLLLQVPPLTKSAEDEAKQALENLKVIVNENNFRRFGLDAPSQILTATIAPPFSIQQVRFDRLRSFSPQKSVKSLLSEGEEYLFPIIVNGQPRLAIRVVKREAVWSAAEIGNTTQIKQIYASMEELDDSTVKNNSEYTLVKVPDLDVEYLSRTGNNGLSDQSKIVQLNLRSKSKVSFPANANVNTHEDPIISMAPEKMVNNQVTKRAKPLFVNLSIEAKQKKID